MCPKEGTLPQKNISSNHNQCSCESNYGPVTACAPSGTEFNSKFRDEKFSFGRKIGTFVKSNPEVLEWISGLKIDFNLEQTQKRVPQQTKMSFQDSNLVKTMLRKSAIQKVFLKKRAVCEQFVSSKQKG